MSPKNKPTAYCLTEFHGESENNNRFSPRGLSFWANTVFKKNSFINTINHKNLFEICTTCKVSFDLLQSLAGHLIFLLYNKK